MRMDRIKKPFEEYHGKYVQVNHANGSITIKGLLRDCNDGWVIIRPYLRYTWDEKFSKQLCLYDKDYTLPLDKVGTLSEITLRDILREIVYTNREEQKKLQ